jgi:hypothetical protein
MGSFLLGPKTVIPGTFSSFTFYTAIVAIEATGTYAYVAFHGHTYVARHPRERNLSFGTASRAPATRLRFDGREPTFKAELVLQGAILRDMYCPIIPP